MEPSPPLSLARRLRLACNRFRPVHIPQWIEHTQDGLGQGLALPIGRKRLWVVSPDAELRPNSAASLCLLAPSSAFLGRPIHLRDALPDARFLQGLRQATEMLGGWLGHPAVRVRLPTNVAPPTTRARTGAGTGLFFSGGVDSFYALHRRDDVTHLAHIVGFDIPITRQDLWQARVTAFRELSRRVDRRAIVVFTNLRTLRRLRRPPWTFYHGAVLAGIGHLLGNEAQTWVMSATYQRSNLAPWGSHPDLDPLWSSQEVHFQHEGDDIWRADKLLAMRNRPEVHEFLQVCWKSPDSQGNCGRCEKCVRTRLIYRTAMPDVICRTMPQTADLAQAINGLSPLPSQAYCRVYARFRDASTDEPEVFRALQSLLERSGYQAS